MATKEPTWAEYFRATPPPTGLDVHSAAMRQFVEAQRVAGRRTVLVTSGGTTVPLEQQTVRFLDNFSAGTRGSASTEYFLDRGYAVIFMHRHHSLEPFTRHFPRERFFELFALKQDDTKVEVAPQYHEQLRANLVKYHKAVSEGRLLKIPFVTVTDYLFLLREASHVMSALGSAAMLYLAAAVSDFFIPSSAMTQHKIQSGDGPLRLTMEQVPKILAPLVREWAPHAFTISFKLETDPAILISKARGSIERYGHQLVIGNILNTRKYTVTFVTREGATDLTLPPNERDDPNREIETDIVDRVIALHDAFVATNPGDG